ncbi:DNA topoisomerase III alpha, partial [Pseudoloma neurophilia]
DKKSSIQSIDDTLKGKITDINVKDTIRYRPLPLRTVDMQKALSRFMSSDSLMKIAEDLYTRGIISYPRTETDCFDKTFNWRQTLQNVTRSVNDHTTGNNDLFTENTTTMNGISMNTITVNGISMVWNGPRKGKNNDFAHSPIYPLKPFHSDKRDEQLVYNYIKDRFIACCSEDAIIEECRVKMAVFKGQFTEYFTCNGKRVKREGYLAIYKHDRVNEQRIGNFIQNEVFVIKYSSNYQDSEQTALNSEHTAFNSQNREVRNHYSNNESEHRGTRNHYSNNVSENTAFNSQNRGTRNVLFMKKSQTQPPSHLKEPDLISLMDKYGIGTDATIHEHIKKILIRNYAFKKNGYFLPSYLGRNLILFYKRLNLNLDKPVFRADLEKKLKRIENGEILRSNVISEEIEMYKRFYRVIEGNIGTFSENLSGDTGDFGGNGFGGDGFGGNGFGGNGFGGNSTGGSNTGSFGGHPFKKRKKTEQAIVQPPGHGNQRGNHSNESEENRPYNRNRDKTRNHQSRDKTRNHQSREKTRNQNETSTLKISYEDCDTNVQCNCREPALIKIVQKGKNKDKEYFGCKNNNCQFFKWKGIQNLVDQHGPSEIKCQCGDITRKMVSNT